MITEAEVDILDRHIRKASTLTAFLQGAPQSVDLDTGKILQAETIEESPQRMVEERSAAREKNRE